MRPSVRSPSARFWVLLSGVVLAASLLISWNGIPAALGQDAGDGGAGEAPAHYGLWSLLPAAIALGLAYATRQVLPALFLGVISGSVVVFFHTYEWSDLNFLSKFFIPALGSADYAKILLIYLWFLGGILGIWAKTGGARYFAERVGAALAKGPRGSKLFAWTIGCIFHQGGTVSTVLAGTTVKPVADRHRVSHEELSYIVDSTASPVATIIPFNAWPAYIGGLVAGLQLAPEGQETFVLIPTSEEGVSWFLRSIPWNFYAIFAVISTLLLSLEVLPWTGRVMKQATRRARETGKLDADSAAPLIDSQEMTGREHEGYRTGLVDFLVPLGVLLGVVIVPFVWTGGSTLPIGEAFLSCTLSAMVIARAKGMPLRVVLDAFVDGCKSMTFGAIILGLAVTLGAVSRELGTANYLIAGVGEWFPTLLLPMALTLICMAVAFSIGSSWGTYAVMFPISVPLALHLAIRAQGLGDEPIASLAETHPEEWSNILLYVSVCFGAVMGGAVFGDQCSPISDTTILSSMFTGCDLMDHVRTQLPLALVAAGLGAICSTLVVMIAT